MSKKNLTDQEYQDYFNNKRKRNLKRFLPNDEKRRKKFIALSIVLSIFFIFIIYIIVGLPSFEELENPRPTLASKVYTIDGELLGQFFIENRIETNIDSLPAHLIEALIATEDRDFYEHWGVDLERFGKAMFKNIFLFSREGASTITQQLAKNLYSLKSRDENFFDTGVRKIREWITAVQLERTFTKKEILEMYFNISYFGRSAYGIETAARIYFDKKAANLTLPESATFIALLKSPENYDPIKNPEASARRRDLVLRNMVSAGYLTEAKYADIKDQPIKVAFELRTIKKTIAPHFMEYVRQQLESMSDKYGFDLYRDGLSIYTTLDYRMQKIANRVTEEHLKQYQTLFNKNWNWEKNKGLLVSLVDKAIKNLDEYRTAENDEDKALIYNKYKNEQHFIDSVKKAETRIQIGFTALDPTNGHIKAMVGGSDPNLGRGLNHVTGIRRQPGSSFKPFVYATAIENGYSPSTSLLNEKFNYNGWSPSNSNNQYGGYMTLRTALAYSVNVISGRMTISDIAPPKEVISYAHKMGIKTELSPYPSIALGTSEVIPLEIISAFGTFANNGIHVEPISILKIEDRNGITLDEFSSNYEEAIKPSTASIMTSMMQDVINYGTGAGVRAYFHRPAAGKTGTTQNYSDAWFIGFTPQYVAGAWVGFDDHRVKFTSSYGQGARAAMPVWAKFMEAAYKELNVPLQYFEVPKEVKTVTLCAESVYNGDPMLAHSGCPSTITEVWNDSVPPRICDIHPRENITPQEDKRGETGWSH